MPVESHAILSPSSAHRWLECTPSARFAEQFPDTAGDAAREGTLAHALCEAKLYSLLGKLKPTDLMRVVKKIKSDPMYTAEMDEYAQGYADFVRMKFDEAKLRTPGAELWIERKIDYSEYAPKGTGTNDASVISDGTLEVIDFKYGKGVKVSADRNPQMMIYALGVLAEASILYDIETVRMSIFQPRIGNIVDYTMPTTELLQWGNEVLKPKAALAFEGEGEYVAGEHCKFCPGRNQCKALAAKQLEYVRKHEFADSNIMTPEDIAEIVQGASQFKTWLSGVEGFALEQAIAGKKFPGLKLVEGRSVRAYSNSDAVAYALQKAGFDEAVLYTRSLLGLTAMEKVVGKKKFTEICGELIIKPKGKPTLTGEDDPRPEYSSVDSEFNDAPDESFI